jgi:malate dehydrogenase (oxaloacetate-decarboxylating)(NADP+)
LASIRPSSTIPVCLDLGTNNQQFLDDPLYLGLRQRRVSGPEMTEFMDEFMHEMSVAFPKLLVQFEVNSKTSNHVPCEGIDLPL